MPSSPCRTAAKHSHSSRRATAQAPHHAALVAQARMRWVRAASEGGIRRWASSNSRSGIVRTCKVINSAGSGIDAHSKPHNEL